MVNKQQKSLIELFVVIAVLVILALIISPLFNKSYEISPQTTCSSQLRQLATAVQMNAQDNKGKLPGCQVSPGTWDALLDSYVGNRVMYHCPNDANTDTTTVSYAYSALLVRPDRNGIKEAQVISPSDAGVFCDADASRSFGGLVGGGASLGADYTRTPVARHNGIIIGYCDGHTKFYPGKTWSNRDMSDPVNRAFFMATSLGWVDNPCSGFEKKWQSNAIAGSNIIIGGEYCTRPILRAAAELWKSNGSTDYRMTGWKGQNEPISKTLAKNNPDGWVYGCGDNGVLTGTDTNRRCFAKDAVVFIVSVNSLISVSPYDGTAPYYIGKIASGDYATNTACLAAMWANSVGYSAPSALCYQVYDMNARADNGYLSGTHAFVMSKLGLSMTTYGAAQQSAVTAYNDEDMVNKVASDPFGIGYCSAAFADTNRVFILGIAGGKTAVNSSTMPNPRDGDYAHGVQLFPSCIKEKRWELSGAPGAGGLNWPFARNLYIKYSNSAGIQPAGTFAADIIKGGSLNNLLLSGPLYRASYYKP